MDDQRNDKTILQLRQEINELKMDIAVLAAVGKLYVDAIAEDASMGIQFSLPDLISVAMVKETVGRWYYDANGS